MKDAGIVDGSLIYVKSQDTVKNNDIAVIQIGDQVTIKKYYQDDTGITLIACNPSINDVHYTLKEANDLPVKVIGKVIFVKNYF